MKRLLPFILLTPLAAYASGVLFQDDFETYAVGSPSGMGVNANGAGWGGQNQARTFYGIITDQQCHSGNRCFEFQYGASSDQWQQLGFSLPNIGEVWIQYWIRPSNIKHSTKSPINSKAIRLWNDNGYDDVGYLKMGGSFSNPKANGDDALLCEARKGGSDMAVRCQQGSNGIGNSVVPGGPYIARDQWTRVTFHFKAPSPADDDGIMDWWYNGKKAATNHRVPGYPSKGEPLFSYGYIMGWANTAWTGSGTATFKIDDVIFDTKPDAMQPLE